MYKQLSFVIMASIMLTAIVTIAMYSQTTHAATLVIKKTTVSKGNATNATAGGANMTNATAGGANMTKK